MSGNEAPSPSELARLISDAVGGRQVSVPFPSWAIRQAGRLVEIVRDVTGIPLIFDRWKAEELAIGYWECTAQRARTNLGFQPRIALAEGLRSTARW